MVILENDNSCSIPSDSKRLIGRHPDDPAIALDKKHWPFDIVNEGGAIKFRVMHKGETKTFFPEEISSMVLTKMKDTAEAYLGSVSCCDALSILVSAIALKTTVSSTMNKCYLKPLTKE